MALRQPKRVGSTCLQPAWTGGGLRGFSPSGRSAHKLGALRFEGEASLAHLQRARFDLAKKQDPSWVDEVLCGAAARGWRLREGGARRVVVAERDDWRIYGATRRDVAARLQQRGHMRPAT